MSKYIFIKVNDAEYDPPYNAEQIKKNYGIELYNKLKKDEVHRWRMETGIELIHKEPSKKELERIWKNWQLMSDDMKEKSDKKSIELFGVDNKTNYKRLIKEYGINDMNRKCIICGRQTYNSSGICEKCWEHADEIDENDNLQDTQPKTFYHLSEKELNKPLIPRIPKSDFEEQETPRVCVSSSIQGCLIGINENKDIKGKTFKVYSITTSNYKKPSVKEVADRDITDEYWILEEVKPKYEYDIKIIGKEGSKKEKINGETFEVPTWKYEKIK